MSLSVIAAFALLFTRGEWNPPRFLLNWSPPGLVWGLIIAYPGSIGLVTWGLARNTLRSALTSPADLDHAQREYHHRLTLLRGVAVVLFAFLLFATPWAEWTHFGALTPVFQVLGDLLSLAPFALTLILMWTASFSAERTMRGLLQHEEQTGRQPPFRMTLRGFLDFQIRNQFLTIAAPMTIILFAANLTRGYSDTIRAWARWPWAPDVVLGAVAFGVFLMSPAILRHIWRTRPLEEGPLRNRLEHLCGRIGLRVREILIWESDGQMANAAVMGLISPIRFVLLSDALLRHMSLEQIEAVFGHEAGHVRKRHIEHFLVFAVVGWLVVAGIMEAAGRVFLGQGHDEAFGLLWIEGIGLATTVIVWGLGFGWLSRRFEAQADIHGAQCAAPSGAGCALPCSIHREMKGMESPSGEVCATGAAIFASALEHVAHLNGIPRDEWSWRHSSIVKRIQFLRSLAADPGRARSFDRRIHLVTRILFFVALIGTTTAIVYVGTSPDWTESASTARENL